MVYNNDTGEIVTVSQSATVNPILWLLKAVGKWNQIYQFKKWLSSMKNKPSNFSKNVTGNLSRNE